MGATALGRYHQDFVDLAPGALEVLNVVNIRRPLAGTVEKLLRLQEGMQTHARLQITGMINNTNLATATTEQDLWDGYQMLREVWPETPIQNMWDSPFPSTCICTATGTPISSTG